MPDYEGGGRAEVCEEDSAAFMNDVRGFDVLVAYALSMHIRKSRGQTDEPTPQPFSPLL
jgi:hypothetical protein